MKASRDLPNLVKDLEQYKDKKILTVCTGGVRCEKMSAYLLDQGFKDVSQLHNGIHTYMQKFPGENFKGTLYTFDNRMTMDFGGEKREVVGECLFAKKKQKNMDTVLLLCVTNIYCFVINILKNQFSVQKNVKQIIS
jgi:UPF0176 protein